MFYRPRCSFSFPRLQLEPFNSGDSLLSLEQPPRVLASCASPSQISSSILISLPLPPLPSFVLPFLVRSHDSLVYTGNTVLAASKVEIRVNIPSMLRHSPRTDSRSRI